MGPTVLPCSEKGGTHIHIHTHTYTHIHSWLGYVMKQRNEEWNRQFSFVIRHKIIDICSVSE